MKGTKTSNRLGCFNAGSIKRFCSIRVFFVKSSTSFDEPIQLNSFKKHSLFFNCESFFCSIWFNGRVNSCIEPMSLVRESSKTERSMWYAGVMVHRTCHKVPGKFQDHLITVVHSSSSIPFIISWMNRSFSNLGQSTQSNFMIFNSAFL